MSTPEEAIENKTQGNTGPSLLKAAGLIAAITVFSKLVGFVRDWMIFHVYGATLATDAYFAAVQIPWFAMILMGGLGGPFHTATVSVFAKIMDGKGPPSGEAKRLAAVLVTLTGILFTLLSVAVYFAAEPMMATLMPGAKSELIAIAATHLRIMAPTVLIGGLVGIFYGLLNVYHCYVWPSLSPTALSVVMIVVLLMTSGDPTGQLLAWSTLGGSVAQLLLQLPEFLKTGFSIKPTLKLPQDLQDPHIRQIGEIIFPMLVGTTISQLMVYTDMFFVSALPEEGAWSAIVLSNRLIQLPIGVLQTALLVPIFPRFARYVAAADWQGLQRDFRLGVAGLWLISMPMLVMLLFYTEPLIRAIFQHGQFDAAATQLVSLAVVYQAFQMIPYFARDTLTRVFYALGDAKTPMIVGFVAIGTKYLLNWLLVGQLGMGVAGITLGTTLITTLNMILLGIFVKRRGVVIGYKALVKPFLKFGAAALSMAGVLVVATPVWQAHMPALLVPTLGETVASLLMVVALGLLGLLAYGGVTLALKAPESEYVLGRILERIRRR